MEQHTHNRAAHLQHFGTSEELMNSITKEGSHGLWDTGYQGLLMWRQKRNELGDVFPPTSEEEMVKKLSDHLNENQFD